VKKVGDAIIPLISSGSVFDSNHVLKAVNRYV